MFSFENFMPHGHCFLWRPDLLWSLVIGNAVIALSYFSIPLSLIVLTRKRRNDRLKWVLVMFSAFIFACGATHVVDIIVIWYPNYWLDAGFKLATASISAVTAVALWPIVTTARAFVSNQQTETEYLKGVNTQLNQSVAALQQQHSDYEMLNRMSGYLQVCNNIDEISKTIVDTVKTTWSHTQGALYLMQPDESEFCLAGQWGNGDLPETIDQQNCWAYRLARAFPDDEDQTNHSCDIGGCGSLNEKLCLPIIAGGKTLGLLHLQGLFWPLDERNNNLLPLLLERAGFAIYSMRLHESLEFKSTRDSLTNLYNRRYLDETLQSEIDRADRSKLSLCVVMFDLDHFKQINDIHGHDAGDRALQLFAGLIRENLRSGDTPCRYGGEEFTLILPDTSLEQAVEVANRIRIRLELETRSETSVDASLRNLTTSAGVAQFGSHGEDRDSLIHQADQALYRAKQNGRNRVLTAGDTTV